MSANFVEVANFLNDLLLIRKQFVPNQLQLFIITRVDQNLFSEQLTPERLCVELTNTETLLS